MESKPKIFNSTKFSPNPWVPQVKLFHIPVRTGHTYTGIDTNNFNKNMCRLCLLFPSVRVHFIQKIFILHNFHITQTIDTLLYIKNIKKSNRLRKEMNVRKNTSARCYPFVKKTLFQRIIEEEEIDAKRVILPNITFGQTNCDAFYENNLSLTPLTVPEYNAVHPVDEIVYNEEDNIEVIGYGANKSEINPSNILNPYKIRLRVQRHPPGFYSSKLPGEEIAEVLGDDDDEHEEYPSSIRLRIQRHALGHYSSKLIEQNLEASGHDSDDTETLQFKTGRLI